MQVLFYYNCIYLEKISLKVLIVADFKIFLELQMKNCFLLSLDTYF